MPFSLQSLYTLTRKQYSTSKIENRHSAGWWQIKTESIDNLIILRFKNIFTILALTHFNDFNATLVSSKLAGFCTTGAVWWQTTSSTFRSLVSLWICSKSRACVAPDVEINAFWPSLELLYSFLLVLDISWVGNSDRCPRNTALAINAQSVITSIFRFDRSAAKSERDLNASLKSCF